MINKAQVRKFVEAARSDEAADLVRAALIIPYVEHPRVEHEATLAELKTELEETA